MHIVNHLIAIETSSDICSASLFMDGKLATIRENPTPRSHSTSLPVYLKELLNYADIKIQAIALSIGPGSFTGLRIGTSLVKGLAFALNIPVIPVPTIDTIKCQIKNTNDFTICIHSYGDNIYKCHFKNGKASEKIKFMKTGELVDGIKYFGSGLSSVATIIPDFTEIKLSSRWVGELALQNYNKWKINNLKLLHPFYLNEFNPVQK